MELKKPYFRGAAAGLLFLFTCQLLLSANRVEGADGDITDCKIGQNVGKCYQRICGKFCDDNSCKMYQDQEKNDNYFCRCQQKPADSAALKCEEDVKKANTQIGDIMTNEETAKLISKCEQSCKLDGNKRPIFCNRKSPFCTITKPKATFLCICQAPNGGMSSEEKAEESGQKDDGSSKLKLFIRVMRGLFRGLINPMLTYFGKNN